MHDDASDQPGATVHDYRIERLGRARLVEGHASPATEVFESRTVALHNNFSVKRSLITL